VVPAEMTGAGEADTEDGIRHYGWVPASR
jgi:hypothetical protein